MLKQMKTWEEAYEAATEELALRQQQMTVTEFGELVQDRARELMGLPPFARLRQGRRLSELQFMEVAQTATMMLDDMRDRYIPADFRLVGRGTLVVLFRLTDRPDLALTIEVATLEGVMGLSEAARHAAVRAYDLLTPQHLAMLKKGPPK